VLSGAAFALVHIAPRNFVSLFVLGALFGVARLKTGRLWAPIIAHALWNGGTLLRAWAVLS